MSDYFEHYDKLPKEIPNANNRNREMTAEQYDNLPSDVKSIVDSWDDNKELYAECARIKDELNYLGWTCDYGLDGEVYDVRPNILTT